MPLDHGIILNKAGELYKKLELLRRENELAMDRNIICRMGLMKSLDEPGVPSWEEYKNCFSAENCSDAFQIRKDVLTGKFHSLFIALIKQRLIEDSLLDLSEENIDKSFKSHLARGVLRCIPARAKSIAAIHELL